MMIYKHIIFIDSNNNILNADSIPEDQLVPDEAIIVEQSEEQYFIPPLAQENGNWGIWSPGDLVLVPIYHYDRNTNTITKRNQADIDADLAAAPTPPPPQPSQLDRIESQVAYTAMMTDTLIEEEE